VLCADEIGIAGSVGIRMSGVVFNVAGRAGVGVGGIGVEAIGAVSSTGKVASFPFVKTQIPIIQFNFRTAGSCKSSKSSTKSGIGSFARSGTIYSSRPG
jgi:hypothetical protein